MFWERFIAFRYLRLNKKHVYMNICNLLASVGIFLGVLSLVLVIAMMNGLENNIKEALFSFQPDLSLSRGSLPIAPEIYSKIRGESSGLGIYKAYRLPMIAKRDMIFKGVDIYAVDKDYLENILGLSPQSDRFLYIGKLLSAELQIKAGESMGFLMPFSNSISTVSVPVTDIFESRLVDIDLGNVYIERSSFLELFGIKAELNEIHIDNIRNDRELKRLKNALTEEYADDYTVSSVFDRNKDLFSAMKLEKIAMIIMLSIIILLGCFNIISSLLMLVTEKVQDIGILRAIGGKSRSLKRIFAMQGLFIGIFSTLAGAVCGTVLSILFDRYRLINAASQGLYIDYIPFKVDILSLFAIITLSLAINVISTYIPTKNISNLTIIKALYYGK